MPKLKTHSGAKKRVRLTGRGKVRRPRAGRRHLLRGKSRRRKRQLHLDRGLSRGMEPQVQRLLPYGLPK